LQLTLTPRTISDGSYTQFINKCGSGSPVFLYQEDLTAQGSTTVDGPLKGGVAWVEGFAGANCAYSGAGCGTVEFTLINPGDDPANPDNSVNYSLQAENHQ